MKTSLLLSLCCLFLFSCSESEVKIEENVSGYYSVDSIKINGKTYTPDEESYMFLGKGVVYELTFDVTVQGNPVFFFSDQDFGVEKSGGKYLVKRFNKDSELFVTIKNKKYDYNRNGIIMKGSFKER